jgi:hypothetical protein
LDVTVTRGLPFLLESAVASICIETWKHPNCSSSYGIPYAIHQPSFPWSRLFNP